MSSSVDVTLHQLAQVYVINRGTSEIIMVISTLFSFITIYSTDNLFSHFAGIIRSNGHFSSLRCGLLSVSNVLAMKAKQNSSRDPVGFRSSRSGLWSNAYFSSLKSKVRFITSNCSIATDDCFYKRCF